LLVFIVDISFIKILLPPNGQRRLPRGEAEWDTRGWAGVDIVLEQEKLEARKMLVNRAETHTSGHSLR